MPMPDRQVIHETDDHGQAIVRVELTHGYWGMLNADDWSRISADFGKKWAARVKTAQPSVGKSVRVLSGEQRWIAMSRAITGAPQGQTIKVLGNDPLDLRRQNLKLCGKPKSEPDTLLIPKAWATDEDRAKARELLPAPEEQPPADRKVIVEPTKRRQPVDRTGPARQRPARVARLAARLADARNRRWLVPDVYLSDAQRCRGYLTTAETNHVLVVAALRRAEEDDRPGQSRQRVSIGQASRQCPVVKPRATA